MFKSAQRLILFSLLFGVFSSASLMAQTKLLRFPDLHGDQVVFTYAGDLWIASDSGGTAARLTTHPGVELFAKFSPDGTMIAFTGQYEGDEQVYVMPSSGGIPKQLTFYPALGPLPPRWGYDHQVYGFTPDGQHILFRSMRESWDVGSPKLFTVPVAGGLPTALPMPSGGSGTFTGDSNQLVYSPLFRDFRHWKRYEGGWAQDLYSFDVESHDTRRLTDHPRSDRDPMWIDGQMYFSSDRTGTLNIYRHVEGGEPTALTASTEWDVRWPSADETSGRIVYELNGELSILDVATQRAVSISIDVPTDGLASRPTRQAVGDQITDFSLGPKGKRAIFAARGDLFTVPVEHGPVRVLTRTPGARERQPAWSPDGSAIAYVSDVDGEDAIYVLSPPDGYGQTRRIVGTPELGAGNYSELAWAADSSHLAFRDRRGKLFTVDVDSGEWLEVADDDSPFSLSFAWSPRGHFLAYSMTPRETGLSRLYIWDHQERKNHQVSSSMFQEIQPSWDPEGNYLFFMSPREFAPQLGTFEFNYAVNRATAIFALALRKDVPHPLPPRSDEVEIAKESPDAAGNEPEAKGDKGKKSKKSKAKDDEKDKDNVETFTIDFDGLGDRVIRMPVGADNYFGIAAVEGGFLYVRGFSFYYGRQSDRTAELRYFSFEDREESTLAENVNGVTISPDGSAAMISQRGRFSVLEIGPKAKPKAVSTADLAVDVVPDEEWAQIFDEVWRRFRDYFYVDNMHGYDWQALRDAYEPLLEHVGHRSDLNYLMSEMIAELNVSHAYVSGGDLGRPDRPQPALLGATFELDKDNGHYRIAKILEGQNAEGRYRSPLTEVGVDVQVGDYLLAIGGAELRSEDNPYRLLQHAGGDILELTVGSVPDFAKARHVLVRPIDSEADLHYLEWIQDMRHRVDKATDGRVGYLHIPDMGSAGIREFIKWFYPQIRKEGLVIDVRSNGGGNVSGMIIERLRRELLMLDYERNSNVVDTYPDSTFHGHMVCLIDEDTASDGDQFAYVFRRSGLGPLIGKRTWGGVVGIYGREGLIDGGSVSVPESGSVNPEGEWVIEGYGVEPDVEVDNDPKELLAGRDQQLDKAIEIILETLEKDPKPIPPRPESPIKTK